MEIHLLMLNKEYHLFELIGKNRLRSNCGLDAIANYSEKNKFNIFHDEGDLFDHIDSMIEPICRICLNKLNLSFEVSG